MAGEGSVHDDREDVMEFMVMGTGVVAPYMLEDQGMEKGEC